MSDKFKVEIISPEKTIISSDAKQVIIPSYEGEMGILKDHIPLITFLRPGVIKILNNTDKKFFVEDGTVEFSNNNLLVLSSTVKEISKIDMNNIKMLLNEAEQKSTQNNLTDKERYSIFYKIQTLKNINK